MTVTVSFGSITPFVGVHPSAVSVAPAATITARVEIIADDIHHPNVHHRQGIQHARAAEGIVGIIRTARPILRIASVSVRKVEVLEVGCSIVE